MEKNEKESRLIAQARATEWKQCRPGLGKAGDPVKNDWTAAKKGKEMKKMYIDASTIITAASLLKKENVEAQKDEADKENNRD